VTTITEEVINKITVVSTTTETRIKKIIS
jgi:hypothetical protein